MQWNMQHQDLNQEPDCLTTKKYWDWCFLAQSAWKTSAANTPLSLWMCFISAQAESQCHSSKWVLAMIVCQHQVRLDFWKHSTSCGIIENGPNIKSNVLPSHSWPISSHAGVLTTKWSTETKPPAWYLFKTKIPSLSLITCCCTTWGLHILAQASTQDIQFGTGQCKVD